MNLDFQKNVVCSRLQRAIKYKHPPKIMVTVSLSYKVLFRLQIGSDKLKLYT